MRIEHLNEYIFAKHNILPATQISSVAEVARNHMGLHSARIMTPYMTLCSRLKEYTPQMLTKQLYKERNLIKMRCMRTTLHIVPHDIASILHMATLMIRVAECKQYFKYHTISIDIVKKIWFDIKDELSISNKAEHIENLIIQRLPSNFIDKCTCAKKILKYYWEIGSLCYINIANDWEKEERRYAMIDRYYPNLRLDEFSIEEAKKLLIYNYIKSFGPVTARDFSWWSGLSVNCFNNFVKDNDNIIKIKCIDSDLVFFIIADEISKLESFKSCQTDWVSLLAYEDPSLKGYKESRNRYVDIKNYDKLFNQIGEVRASIISNGKAIGTWEWNKKHKQITLNFFYPPKKYIYSKVNELKEKYESILSPNKQLYLFKN